MNPNIRKSTETQAKFRKRRLAANHAEHNRLPTMLWPEHWSTYVRAIHGPLHADMRPTTRVNIPRSLRITHDN